MTTREQRAQRRITKAYVKAQPELINLVPHERLVDDQGGWTYIKKQPRFTQMFRLIEAGQPGSNATRDVTGIDGISREVEFLLLGDHCAEVELYDRFELNGDEFEVVDIWADNGWEKRASVVRHART